MTGPAVAEPATTRRWAPTGAEVLLTLVTLAALAGFDRLFVGWGFLPVVAAVAVGTHVLCAVLRRLGAPTVVALLVTGLGTAVLIGAALYRDIAPFGLPMPASWDAAWADVAASWNQFPVVKAPVPVEAGWIVSCVLAVWATAFLADLLAFRLRGGFEALMPSGALFVFASLLGANEARVAWSVAYLGAAALFVLAYRSEGGGGGATWLAGAGSGAAGSVLRSGAVLVVLVAGVAALLGPALPGAGEPALVDWKGRGRGTRITVSPLVDVRGRLVDQSAVEAFTVTSPVPAYWRLTALDRFDGEVWSSEGTYRRAEGVLPVEVTTALPTDTVTQEFTIAQLASIWLPAAFAPVAVDGGASVRFDPLSASLVTGDETADGQTYRVTSRVPVADPAAIAAAPPGAVGPAADLLALPEEFPAEVRQLAVEITAGATSPYEQALALQDFFRANFVYDLAVEPGHSDQAILDFLAQRRGYCEQFAGTFAAMARAIGLPARVAVGFTPGTLVGPETYRVLGENAHAWPEVWLNGVGWVPFEPTPGRSVPGGSGYTGIPEVSIDDAPTTTTSTTAPAEGSPDASLTPEELDALEGLVPEDSGTAGAADGTTRGEASPWPGRLLRVGLVLVAATIGLVAVLLGTKALARARRRAAADTGAARVVVAWEEAVDALHPLGLVPHPQETHAEFARRADARAGSAAPPLRRLAETASAAAFAPDDPPADVVRRAEEDAARVAAAVREMTPLGARIRDALDPRPLFTGRDRRSVADAPHAAGRR